MPLLVKRWLRIALVFASLALSSSNLTAAGEWQVIKVNGHDYLSVDNISKFYGLPAEVVPSGEKMQSGTANHPLEFVSGSREAMINGARSWLCFPVIEQDGKTLVSRTDLAKTIEPLVRPHRVANLGKIQTVVLDPGHGGHDKGQVSRYGPEKDFALDVARKLRPILQAKGLRVIMTREGDYFVPLEVRAQIANRARDAIFVSIHFNASGDDPDATGFEIFSFTPRGAPSTSDGNVNSKSFNMQPGSSVDAQSMALSACVYHSLLGHLPEYDRGIKRARFAVLRLTNVPAVLIEGGFLTERGESKLISNKDWRAKLAGAIGIGIENYQSLPIKKQPPMIVADYRRQMKSSPADAAVQESTAEDADRNAKAAKGNIKQAEGNVKEPAGTVKEADASLLELVGRSAFLAQPQTSAPAKKPSLESAPIIP
jgi:N-acetylmuramoyl-L-alanine amidase